MSQYTILIIEDSPIELLHLKETLTSQNISNYDTATKLEQAIGYLWTRNYDIVIAATGSSLIRPRALAEIHHHVPHYPKVLGLGNAPSDKQYWYQVSTDSYLCHYFFERQEFYSKKNLQEIVRQQFSP